MLRSSNVDATRSQSSRHFGKFGQPHFSAPMVDKYALVPLVACGFSVVLSPLFTFFNPSDERAMLSGMNASPDNRIFWPAIAAISVLLAAQNRSRLAKLTWPPHIICLLAYLGFAG